MRPINQKLKKEPNLINFVLITICNDISTPSGFLNAAAHEQNVGKMNENKFFFPSVTQETISVLLPLCVL